MTDAECRQEHLTRDFSYTPCTCVHTTSWLKTAQDEPSQCISVRVSFHLHVIHDVMCLSVRWSLLVSLSPVSLLLLLLLFLILPVLCPALHPQCRHRPGLKPLHSRRMRSIAPWRYTILSHVEYPSDTNFRAQSSSHSDVAILTLHNHHSTCRMFHLD